MNPPTTSITEPVLTQWLKQTCTFPIDALHEIPGDASFRRYFRLSSGQQTYMVMDASRQMDCFDPYLAIARSLHILGVKAPEILAQDRTQGFMLISDFGNTLYLNVLGSENADSLYKTALDSLAIIQSCSEVRSWPIPAFDQHFMMRELNEFQTWVLDRYLKLNLSVNEREKLQASYHQLSVAANRQVQVFIHRDYHSANLMVLPNNQVGVLDFQDACIGPVTYDLVSLLRDCYIDWPDSQVQTWVAYYYDKLRQEKLLQGISLDEFKVWFDWMGIQRHMKAMFIFTRKYLRDQTPRYLKYLPRTLNYIVKISALYPELKDFHQFVSNLVLPVPEDTLELTGNDR